MSKFSFAVNGVDSRREGIIESDSFRDAVDALAQHVDVKAGDLLEIGVFGFPPARYECLGEMHSGRAIWVPANRLAA